MHEHQDHLEGTPPDARSDLSAAATAWESGDYRVARATLARVAETDLQADQRAVRAQLAHGLALDPMILVTGLVLLVLWGWIFASVAPG